MKNQLKSIGNPVEISTNYHWKFQCNTNENPLEFKSKWNTNVNTLEI